MVPSQAQDETGEAFYAIVVVDSAGRPIPNAWVELTDPNGELEKILAVDGIAMFYDTFGKEGYGFALDFENPYSMKVYDAAGEYRTFTNTAIMLDEDMCIT